MNNSERNSEPREIYEILAEIVANLKPGKENSIDDTTRESNKNSSEQTH